MQYVDAASVWCDTGPKVPTHCIPWLHAFSTSACIRTRAEESPLHSTCANIMIVSAMYLPLSLLLLRLLECLCSACRLLLSPRLSRSRSLGFLSFRLSVASCSALRSRLRSERALGGAASLSLSLSCSLSLSLSLSFALCARANCHHKISFTDVSVVFGYQCQPALHSDCPLGLQALGVAASLSLSLFFSFSAPL